MAGNGILSKIVSPQLKKHKHFLQAVTLGITFFDTAPSYGLSEARLGQFLQTLSPEIKKILVRSLYSIMNKTSNVLSHSKYYVYVFLSQKDHKFYVGYTADLKRRLKEHAEGKVIATKNRLPLKLTHYEYFINEHDAKAREKFLKSGFGRDQMKQALKRTLAEFG